MSNPSKAQWLTEWVVIAVTAVIMSRVGYMLLNQVTADVDWTDWKDTKWVLWSCGVSIATWSVLWRFTRAFTRGRSVVPWLIAGAVSPLLGSFLFSPATGFALLALVTHFQIIIPFGILTGITMYSVVVAMRWVTGQCSRTPPP